MLNQYKALKKQVFSKGEYSIVPIRMKDRSAIMKWRNEQIFHLRQTEPLTIELQDQYFEKVVVKLFDREHPDQLLFSFLKEDVCIGYGGLVHINWIDRNAEISFIMDTELEKEEFDLNWSMFLNLIEKLAFQHLNFHKLFVYAFDLRPYLYPVLLDNGYFLDARLKEHCLFNEKYIDVVIHAKFNNCSLVK